MAVDDAMQANNTCRPDTSRASRLCAEARPFQLGVGGEGGVDEHADEEE